MKVRNWHKRSTGRCLEHNVSMLYVSSTHAPTELETAHISIKREDGMHMDVILSREEFLKFKNEVDWCSSRWLEAAQHGVQPTADHASASVTSETETVAGRGG